MNTISYIDNHLFNASPASHVYEHSPFAEIRKLQAATKGQRFQQIAKSVLTKLGYDVQNRENSGHDLIIDGVKTEVKGATLSGKTEKDLQFKFMQFRLKQDWEQCLLSAYWPQDLRHYIISREYVEKHVESGLFKKHHGGEDADNDLYIYIGDPADLEGAIEVEAVVKNPEKGNLND